MVQFREEHRKILSENAQNYKVLVHQLQEQVTKEKTVAKTRSNCRECPRSRANVDAVVKRYEVLREKYEELGTKNEHLQKARDGLKNEVENLQLQLVTARNDITRYHEESSKLRSELTRLTATARKMSDPSLLSPLVARADHTTSVTSPVLNRSLLVDARAAERKAISAVDLVHVNTPKKYRTMNTRSKAPTVSGAEVTSFGSDSRIVKPGRGQRQAGTQRRFLSTNSQPTFGGVSGRRSTFARRFEPSAAITDASLRDWRRSDRLARKKK